MSKRTIHVLMASSAETSAAIEQSLRRHDAHIVVRRADNKAELLNALDAHTHHLLFSELELTDFSAADIPSMLALLGQKALNMPVVLIKGSGAEEIAIDCLASGASQFIKCTDQYLTRLPSLIDSFIAQAENENARRLIEKRLLESEERYVDIFDNTSDLIQCIKPDGSFIYTNKTWRDTMGYTEQEVASLNLMDVLHPDSMLCCQDRFARLQRGEALTCIDFKFLSKSGETIYLSGDCGSIIKDGAAISTRGIFKNVTDTVKTEDALKRSEARYQTLYENAPDIYTTVNAAGEILSINPIGASMLGYEINELIGESVAKLIHPEDQREVFAYIEKQLSGAGKDHGIDYRNIRKDGSIFWVHQRVSLEPGVEEPRLFVICRDVTEKRNLEAQLEHQASHDTLTNLVNRREFERRLQRILSSAPDATSQHALCFLDLDQFKIINDTCGHIAGDELLRQIAALLQGQMRSRDTLARFGGDEFAVLMEHCPIESAIRLAETLRETVARFLFHWRAQRFTLGVSIGVIAIQAGQNIIDTLTLADAACYTAKKEGRNRIHVERPTDAAAADAS